MTAISLLLAGSVTSLCLWGVARSTDAALPWGELAGGSAALMLFAAFFVFLKHSTDQRKDSHETIRMMASKFAETVQAIQKEATEEHAKCQETIQKLLLGRRDPDRRDPK